MRDVQKGMGCSAFALKCLALAAMVIDHTALALEPVLYPAAPAVYLLMRMIGRLAMPIFCFFIAEGYYHTRKVTAYAARLLLFAVVSEAPFDLFGQGQWLEFSSQNVFFTLFLGLLAIHTFDLLLYQGRKVSAFLALAACTALAHFIASDYAGFGVLYVFAFYLSRGDTRLRPLLFGTAALALAGYYAMPCLLQEGFSFEAGGLLLVNASALLALWPLSRYNGEQGRVTPVLKWGFYAFYPAHLLLLFAVKQLVG